MINVEHSLQNHNLHQIEQRVNIQYSYISEQRFYANNAQNIKMIHSHKQLLSLFTSKQGRSSASCIRDARIC